MLTVVISSSAVSFFWDDPDTVTSRVLLPSLILPAPKRSLPFWKRVNAKSLWTLSFSVKDQLPAKDRAAGWDVVWEGGSSVVTGGVASSLDVVFCVAEVVSAAVSAVDASA